MFSYANGRLVEKYLLPLGTDNIGIVLVQSASIQTDTVLSAYPTLGALLAANSEATFTNYARIILSGSGITVAVNTSTTTTTISVPSQVWNAAGGALNNTMGALITYYRPTSATADSGCLPLTKHDFNVTTTGGNLTATITSIATAT